MRGRKAPAVTLDTEAARRLGLNRRSVHKKLG